MNPDHLLGLAEQIVSTGAGYPRQATLNRAISTAYYALFHALSRLCVERTVGWLRAPRHWEIVTPLYRAIEHASARRVFGALASAPASSATLKQIGRAFVALQEARIEADYNPGSRCTRKGALDYIGQARSAIEVLRTLPPDEQTLLAVKLITKQR